MEKSGSHFGYAENPADVKRYKRCKLADGNPCIPCLQAIKLNDLIIQARKTLDDLLCQKRDLHTEINFSHDRIIHRLPLNVSASIFHLTLSEEAPFSVFFGHYPDTSKQDVITTPLTLGAVSHVWRNIVWALPALWTKIFIPLKPGSDYNYLDIAYDWFKRSGQLPFSILIYTPELESTVEDPDFELLEQLSNFINSCLHRCIRLEISCPSDLLPALIQGNAPILDEIKIISNDAENSSPRIKLRSLRSEGIRASVTGYCLDSLELPFENVREFECVFTLEECVRILQKCPNLQVYRITGLREGSALASDDDEPITHESLKMLALSSKKYPSSSMLEILELPSLTHLMVSDGDTSSIHNFILRSCCNLRYLWIKSIGFDSGELKNLLRSTDLLEELYLVADNVIADNPVAERVVPFGLDVLLRDLSPTPVLRNNRHSTYPRPPLLPNLSVLSMKCQVEQYFPWDVAAEIFGSLDDMRDPRRRPVKDFQIVYDFYTGNSRHAAGYPGESSGFGHPLILNEELTRRFLAICGEGVDIMLYDTRAEDDILRLAMVHHNITVPEWYKSKEQMTLKMERWSAGANRAFEDVQT